MKKCYIQKKIWHLEKKRDDKKQDQENQSRKKKNKSEEELRTLSKKHV